jgi:hypothetical protein
VLLLSAETLKDPSPSRKADGEAFVRDSPITNILVAITGWINPILIFTIVFLLLGKAVRTGEILRYVVLLKIPFSWLALAYQSVYRFRAGYFLWILGMVLSLCLAARKPSLNEQVK